jgi:uncharacterized membrane protein
VASAVLLAGAFAIGGIWLAASTRRPDAARVAPFVQDLLRLTGRAVGVPATVVVLLTGFALWHAGRFSPAHALWLWLALAVFTAAGGIWHWGLIPLRVRMGRLAAEAEASGALPLAYTRAARRWLIVNGVLLALLAVILALMTAKPTMP